MGPCTTHHSHIEQGKGQPRIYNLNPGRYVMLKEKIEQIYTRIEKSVLMGPVIGFIAFLLVFIISFSKPYDLFELKLYDLRFILKPAPPQWEMLSFLNIDDNSINNAGEFPWPRNIYAEGLDVLSSVGIRQVTFDIQFPDPSPQVINNSLAGTLFQKAEARQRISREELGKLIISNDRVLADSIKSSRRVIIPFSFQKEIIKEREMDPAARQTLIKARKLFEKKASLPVPDDRKKLLSGLVDPERINITYPIPELIRSTGLFGFVDSDFDMDGYSRKIRLVRIFRDRVYLHLGLVMLMDSCGVRKEDLVINPGSSIVLKNALNPVSFKRENIEIPIDEKGMMYINWAGPLETTFHRLSYVALMEYRSVREAIHDHFDRMEQGSGKGERSTLYGQLDEKYKIFNNTAEEKEKARLWKEIQEIRKKIRAIELSYTEPVKKQLAELKAAQGMEKSAGIKEQIAEAENFLTAVKLVHEVEGLRDHMAIIGLTATGTQDIGVTPLSSQFMMVGTYHNIVNTILQKRFIHKTGAAVNYFFMLVLALAIGFVAQKLNARQSLLAIAASFIAVNIIIVLFFIFGNIWLDQLGISLSLLLPSVSIAAIKLVREESQKRFIKMAFSHYLSPKVIEEIIKNPPSFQRGGETRTVTTFFSDVAKFSTISEKLSPTELVRLLNEYLSEMTDIILHYDGTIDKYEGDAIMAFYGAPHYFKDHALKACRAALDMQKKLAEMRAVWRKNNRDELYVRMGLNTGEAVVGNMGSRTRMDYTVMGDSVNLASRLEGANKFYSTHIMISENTFKEAQEEIYVRELDYIKVVGKEQPILVYELLGRKGEITDQMQEVLEKYTEALALFRERDWDKARSLFRHVLKINKDDGPAQTYIDRCTEYISTPPPKKWDGVYSLKSK